MAAGNAYLAAGGRAWAEQQLIEAGYADFGGDVVKQVLDVVDAMFIAFPEETASSVSLIAKLISGVPLGEEDWSEQKKAEGYVWRPVLPRSLQVGSVVRVKPDAYPRTHNLFPHNGRQGKVSGIRNGVYVVYDGADSRVTQMGTRHDPVRLERRIMIAQHHDG